MNNTTPAHCDKVTDGGNYYSGLSFFNAIFLQNESVIALNEKKET